MDITNISFGVNQLKNPMPSKLVLGMVVFSSIGGFLISWVGSTNLFHTTTQVTIQSILGLLLGITNSLLPFFGVKTSKENIPVKDVGSMDSDKT